MNQFGSIDALKPFTKQIWSSSSNGKMNFRYENNNCAKEAAATNRRFVVFVFLWVVQVSAPLI